MNTNGIQQGPIDETQLCKEGINGQTLVWRKGMSDWKPASSVIPPQYLSEGGQTFVPRPNNQVHGKTPPPLTPYTQRSFTQNSQCSSTPTQQRKNFNQTPKNTTPPNNYMVWAILTTILCCIPLGIVSIIYAAKVNSQWAAGNVASAYENSNKAKIWCIIAASVGFIPTAVFFILGLVDV